MSLSNAMDVAMTTIMENTSTKPLETADIAPAPLRTSILPTDEQELKDLKKRLGADKTPEEHRAEYLAAHAGNLHDADLFDGLTDGESLG